MRDFERTQANKAEVLRSPLVAKAIVRRNGKYEILAVFKKSTRQEFYWIFQARAKRSPRKAWKVINCHARDFSTYKDFSSFVLWYARLHGAELVTFQTVKIRCLAGLLEETEHESIFGNWEPQADPSMLSFEKVDRKYQRGLKGRRYGFD